MALNRTTGPRDDMREQRRVITALFADTVGSTALGERLDPEDFRDIVGGCVARMIPVVERFGGAVKDPVGDGIVALFGAVAAYEDDAQRAVLAGLDIVEEVAIYATEVARDFGVEGIGVRVGIQSGEAIVGVLVWEAKGWRFLQDAAVEVPPTIEKVVMARVDRVSPQAYETLVAASVVGREFAAALLQEVLGQDEAVRPALEELTRLDLIMGQPAAGSGYRFRHAVIQETVYRSLLRRNRRQLHGRVARALEAMYPDRREDLAATLALHFRAAGQPQEAVGYFTLAGDQAKSAYANAEAIVSYQAALEMLDEAGRIGGPTPATGSSQQSRSLNASETSTISWPITKKRKRHSSAPSRSPLPIFAFSCPACIARSVPPGRSSGSTTGPWNPTEQPRMPSGRLPTPTTMRGGKRG